VEAVTKELATRENNSVSVALLWTRGSDHVIVRVVDGGAGDSFVFEVDACDALDAFYHPYAYASRLEVPCSSPERESTFDVAVPEVVQR
jgi:hypothetical protein